MNQMLGSRTTTCSQSWTKSSWAELSETCFGDAPMYVHYFDFVLMAVFVVSVASMLVSLYIFRDKRAERPDYHQYLVWYLRLHFALTIGIWCWVFATHRTPEAVIASFYAPIAEETGLFELSPDGVSLVYERTLSVILIVCLSLTAQLAWVVIIFRDPHGSRWMAVKYHEIRGSDATKGYDLKAAWRSEPYSTNDTVFIRDGTFYLCSERNTIKLSTREPSSPHYQCWWVQTQIGDRNQRGDWHVRASQKPNGPNQLDVICPNGTPKEGTIAVVLEHLW